MALQFRPHSQLDAAQYRIQMGIDDDEMDRRASLAGLDQEDRALLDRLAAAVERHADRAAANFVTFLSAHPQARVLVQDDAAVARLKASMADHLRTLVGARYDEDYALDRIATALLYASHDIEPKVFSAGFQRALQDVARAWHDELDAETALQGLCVLEKLATMDMALILDVLFWDRARTLQNYQQTVMELSTPVQQVWDGVLMAPIVGTLDTARAQQVMERLLEAIEFHEARFAIIDISGVPTVDTSVAQNLLKTIHAARLMGTRTILSGVRPEIASTMVHFGVELGEVATQRTMREALRLAIRHLDAESVHAPNLAASTAASGASGSASPSPVGQIGRAPYAGDAGGGGANSGGSNGNGRRTSRHDPLVHLESRA